MTPQGDKVGDLCVDAISRLRARQTILNRSPKFSAWVALLNLAR
jgi:hypothetical protein